MFLLINGKRLKEEPKEKRKDGKKQEVKELNFTKIEKLKNSISCFKNEQLYCTFSNIKNWDSFSVEGGEFETKVTKEELLLKEIANLKLENKKKDSMANTMAKTIADLNIRINKLEKEGK